METLSVIVAIFVVLYLVYYAHATYKQWNNMDHDQRKYHIEGVIGLVGMTVITTVEAYLLCIG